MQVFRTRLELTISQIFAGFRMGKRVGLENQTEQSKVMDVPFRERSNRSAKQPVRSNKLLVVSLILVGVTSGIYIGYRSHQVNWETVREGMHGRSLTESVPIQALVNSTTQPQANLPRPVITNLDQMLIPSPISQMAGTAFQLPFPPGKPTATSVNKTKVVEDDAIEVDLTPRTKTTSTLMTRRDETLTLNFDAVDAKHAGWK